MKKQKGLLFLVILMVLLLAPGLLTACGGKKGNTEEDTQQSSSNKEATKGYRIYDATQDIIIYVDDKGVIEYVETWNEDKMNQGIQDVMGQKIEEGLTKLYQEILYEAGHIGDLSFVYWDVMTLEEGVKDALKVKLEKLLKEIVEDSAFSKATWEVAVNEFTKNNYPEEYARYEELFVDSYAEAEALLEKYQTLAESAGVAPSQAEIDEFGGFMEVAVNEDTDAPAYLLYEKKPEIKALNITGTMVSLQIEKIGGLDAYRVLFYLDHSYASGIYYKDGTVKESLGFAEFYKDLDGEAEFGYVKLDNATLESYEEIDGIFTKYADTVEQEDDWWATLYVWKGDQSILIMKDLESGNYEVCWPNKEDGNTTVDESYIYGPDNYLGYEKIVYDKDGQCLSQYFETPETTKEFTWTYGVITYRKSVTTIKETGKVMWEESKTLPDGSSYPLRKENEKLIREYTYTYEDSGVLLTYYAYSSVYDEEVTWTFDGNGPYGEDYYSHVVGLERTFESVTTTYTKDQIPWGSGLLTPPRNDLELVQ